MIQRSDATASATPSSFPHSLATTAEPPAEEGSTSEPGAVNDVGELKHLADYDITERLARGGMGVVFLARHRILGRLVALKVVATGGFSTEAEIARFRTEAEAAANLQHGNIAAVYETGYSAGLSFIAMQYVDGGSLRCWYREQQPSADTATEIMLQVASAMQHAHEHGVIHRDLKPDNIMMERNGIPKIVDFGLAKRLHDTNMMTLTGQVMGTPSFMAPEQAAGETKRVGPAADIYAIGATLFFLLTGRAPFESESLQETLSQLCNSVAPSARSLNRRVPRDLDIICAKCLEKRPEQRYASAAALAEDLQRYLDRKPILARRISRTQRMLRWSNRNRLATAFMIVVTLLLLTVSSLYIRTNHAIVDAERSFRKQLQAVNELLVQIAAGDLRNVPNSHAIRRDLLVKAERFYQEAAQHSRTQARLDDLTVQAKFQLARIHGELANSDDQRSNALAMLRDTEDQLVALLKQDAEPVGVSLAEVLLIYSVDAPSRLRWTAIAEGGEFAESMLVRWIRQSMLTEVLSLQLHLHPNLHDQVNLARRLLQQRQEIAAMFPDDPEAARLLAGAHQNLAESLRELAKKESWTSATKKASEAFAATDAVATLLGEAYTQAVTAQALRARWFNRTPAEPTIREKLILENAKGARALATIIETCIALDHTEVFNDIVEKEQTLGPDAMLAEQMLQQYQIAIDSFLSLQDSLWYSIEANRSRAVTLRERARFMLNSASGEALSEDGIRSSLADLSLSVAILQQLANTNYRVAEFQIDFLDSVSAAVRSVAEFEQFASPAEMQLLTYSYLRERVSDCEALADAFPDRLAGIYVPLLVMLPSLAASETEAREAIDLTKRGLAWLSGVAGQIPDESILVYQEVLASCLTL